jgi:hypothetical protein
VGAHALRHAVEPRDQLGELPGLDEDRARLGVPGRGDRHAAHVEARAVAEARERAEQHPLCAERLRRRAGRLRVGRRLRGVVDAEHADAGLLPEPRGEHVGEAVAEIRVVLERMHDDGQDRDRAPLLRVRGAGGEGEQEREGPGER